MKPVTKTYRQLTERQYLGVGYVHQFTNDETQETVFIPCAELEYTRLGLEGGSQFNPVLEGHTWVSSLGGTHKVNTVDSILGKDEYFVRGEEIVARLMDADLIKTAWVSLPKTAVNVEHRLDESKVIELGYGDSV